MHNFDFGFKKNKNSKMTLFPYIIISLNLLHFVTSVCSDKEDEGNKVTKII